MTTYRDRHLAGLYASDEAKEQATIDDLKQALRVLGQPVTGNKTQLEKRLAKAQKEVASH